VHAHTNFSQLLLGVDGKVFIVIVAHKKPSFFTTVSCRENPAFLLPQTCRNYCFIWVLLNYWIVKSVVHWCFDDPHMQVKV